MKYIAPLLALSALLLPLADVSAQTVHKVWAYPIVQGVAAQVEDHIITFEEVRGEMMPLMPRIEQESKSEEEFNRKMSALYLDTVQSLIDNYLIVQEFAEKKYNFPPSVIENEYDRVLIEDFNNDRMAFHRYLNSIGMNVREYRTDLRNKFIVSAMRGNMRKSMSAVSPEKITAFYNQNQQQFFREESIHLRLIMLKPIGDESPDLMRQQVDNILADIAAGKPFAEIAKTYSQDSRRSRGGDWGWISRKDLNPALADMAFSIRTGEHSQPLAVGKQIYILYVEDRRPEGVQPLVDVREEIENTIAGQMSRQAQQAWIQRLRQKAYVRYY
ncbi:MAG TPA: peptidylprolyl isomerase [Opitutales bacterium]|nr:peptidylprolyl isomerase [Opitutales bacterium]